mgnify:CR=1 FL=1
MQKEKTEAEITEEQRKSMAAYLNKLEKLRLAKAEKKRRAHQHKMKCQANKKKRKKKR